MAPAEGRHGAAGFIGVTVVYSPRARVVEQVQLQLPDEATVADALRASGLAQRHGWALDGSLAVSIWSRPAALLGALRDADRVEVTRGLLVDPKEARRQRYREQPGKLPVKRRAPPPRP